MAKIVIVDFWDVLDIQQQPFDFRGLMEQISRLPRTDRMKDRGSHIDYLAEVSTDNNTASGTAVRARTQDWPGTVNTATGDLGELNLDADTVIGEEMSFHFDRTLQVLATQRNLYLRASRFAKLALEIGGAPFEIQPKLREDAWLRLQRMRMSWSVEIKVRGPLRHPQFSSSAPSVSRLIQEASNEVNAINVDLVLSTGRSRARGLNANPIRAVADYFRRHTEDLRGLKIKGSRADEEAAETIDFVKDRLIFSGEVPYTNNRLDRNQCQRLLRRAINENRQYLRDLIA